MGAKTEITKYIGLKLKRNGVIDPSFVERVPENGNRYNTIEGYLVSAEITEKQFEEDKFTQYVLILNDNEGETDIVDFREGGTGYSLISSLASCNFKNYIKITVKKVLNEKQEPVPRVEVIQGGKRVSWIEGADAAPHDDPDRKEYFNNLFKTKVIDRI